MDKPRADLDHIVKGSIDVETALYQAVAALKLVLDRDDLWETFIKQIPGDEPERCMEKLQVALANLDLPVHVGPLPLDDARLVLRGAHKVSYGIDRPEVITTLCEHGGGRVEIALGEHRAVSLCPRCAAIVQGQILGGIIERAIERAVGGRSSALRVE